MKIAMTPELFSMMIRTDFSHCEIVYQIIVQVYFNIKAGDSPEIPDVGQTFYQNDTIYLAVKHLPQGFPLENQNRIGIRKPEQDWYK